MFELKIITGFSAAHQLRNFQGPCEHLHGHNWKIEVCVAAAGLDQAGMVIDFAILKKMTNDIIERLDHKFLNDLEEFRDQNPSSEYIAQYIAQELSFRLSSTLAKVTRVTTWESETASATYYPPAFSTHLNPIVLDHD